MMLQHPFPTLPDPGIRLEVAPGIFWLRMPLPFVLNHINLWLIADGDGWTVVDTGFAAEPVKAAWEQAIAGLDGAPITRIIVTHFHPDHLGLASWLAEKTGAKVWMTAGEFLTAHLVWHQLASHGIPAMLDFFRANGLDEASLAALGDRGNPYRKGVPALPQTYHRIYDGDVLDIGGRQWTIEVGHGHSPEHAALHCHEAGVLISGDMLLPRITTNISVFAATPDADNLGAYLDSLQVWRGIDPETLVLPSHGLPFRGVDFRLDALAAHHVERLDRVMSACVDPRTAAELIPLLFEREIDAYQSMFAMGESIAHLNHLVARGQLSPSRGVDGVSRFQQRQPNGHDFEQTKVKPVSLTPDPSPALRARGDS